MEWNIYAEYEVRGSSGHVSTAPKNYRLKPWLTGPIFEPLNKHYFKKFFIDGLTIAWSNGADMRLKAYTEQL